MRISRDKLVAEAQSTGFRPEVIEKVAHLLGLLDVIQTHPFLKGKLVLKGGTALNLFYFDVPRLSVDIDLNYIGEEDMEAMLAQRPNFEKAFHAVFAREGYIVRRMPEEHAGGKWLLCYQDSTGRTGVLEVDVNYMFRVPLWPARIIGSKSVGAWCAADIPVLDIHELAAGKLAALFSRGQARDLFDCNKILRIEHINVEKLRIAFVVYGAMNRKDWRTVSAEEVNFDPEELTRQLVPMLRKDAKQNKEALEKYGKQLVEECRLALSVVLPFTKLEKAFLDGLLDRGEIDPTILTKDPALQDRIKRQPLLEWKAVNVREHKSGG